MGHLLRHGLGGWLGRALPQIGQAACKLHQLQGIQRPGRHVAGLPSGNLGLGYASSPRNFGLRKVRAQLFKGSFELVHAAFYAHLHSFSNHYCITQ